MWMLLSERRRQPLVNHERQRAWRSGCDGGATPLVPNQPCSPSNIAVSVEKSRYPAPAPVLPGVVVSRFSISAQEKAPEHRHSGSGSRLSPDDDRIVAGSPTFVQCV